MNAQCRKLQAVILDWAGTTVDHGSRAPAIVFQEIFRQHGVAITADEARAPMGKAKREHIAAILALPSVARRWQETHGRPSGDADIESMYVDFLPLQMEVLKEHCQVIAGVPEAVAECRRMGLKIGSTTGYTRALMDLVTAAAREQDYDPECVICAEDVPRGRPAPFLLFEAAKRLDVFPMASVVAVDDTPVGIEAGRNAGCWTIGITRTGNGVGLSEDEFEALSLDEQRQKCAAAAQTLRDAGVHELIESLAELPRVVRELTQRLEHGELPG